MTPQPFQGSSLCVVGNINRDLRTAPFAPDDRLFHDGETSISFVCETIGGGGANSACAAAALGARVGFIGRVGRDYLGGRLERTLAKQKISANLSRDPLHPSGTSIALSYENGHRHFISCLPASQALSMADIDGGILAGYAHLLRADIWFSESMLFEGNLHLFKCARQSGLVVSLDLNWDPLWGWASDEKIRARKQAVRAVLPWVDLAHGNVRELMEFTDATSLELALQRLAEWGAAGVVVHLGDRGSGYVSDGSLVVEPPASIERRVNTTGTGDVLSVCMMLLHHRQEISIPERLCLANRIVAQFIEGKRCFIPVLED